MGRLILISVLSILLSTSVCLARTWYVSTAECPTIQAGIDSAGVGDTVLVAAGTYTGEGNKNLDFSGTDLVLLSEAGPEVTVIDCEGSGRGFYFHSGETAATVVEGFTVTNGDVGIGIGGGMYCSGSSPTVRGCIFSVNTADHGGGMYCYDSSPTVSGCTFSGNTGAYGGGMYCFGSFATVSDCIFSGNSADMGAGMYCEESHGTVSNCTFSGNSATHGGGMFCDTDGPTVSSCIFSGNSAATGGAMSGEHSFATVSSCIFSGNSAGNGNGGGMKFTYSSLTVSSCTFSGNEATGRAGGGMSFFGSSSPTVRGCVFSGNSANRGGGIQCGGEFCRPTVSGCTFSRNWANSGGGIHCSISASLSVENTIIVYSPVGEAIYCELEAVAALTCCDVYGNAGGDWVGCIADQLGINGNFSACPSFCNAEGGGFTLCDESPCLPGNHPDGYDCGLIGAWDVGCVCGPSATEPATWGGIKAMYR